MCGPRFFDLPLNRSFVRNSACADRMAFPDAAATGFALLPSPRPCAMRAFSCIMNAISPILRERSQAR